MTRETENQEVTNGELKEEVETLEVIDFAVFFFYSVRLETQAERGGIDWKTPVKLLVCFTLQNAICDLNLRLNHEKDEREKMLVRFRQELAFKQQELD